MIAPVYTDKILIHWSKAFILTSVTCWVTGEKIPKFTTARRRWETRVVNEKDETELSSFKWVSEKGYTFITMQEGLQ